MANPLTGEFDVAVELLSHTLQRALVALHSDGVLPHRVSARLQDRAAGLDAILLAQVSAPSATLVSGASVLTSEMRFGVRLRLVSLKREEPPLPAWLHGEIRMRVEVAQTSIGGDEVVAFDLGDDDSIRFRPASGAGLPSEELAAVEGALRDFLRNRLVPSRNVARLPGGASELAVRRWRMKGLPANDPSALAVLLDLSPRALGAGDVEGFNGGSLRAGNDFAIAIGAHYLVPKLEQILQSATRAIDGRELTFDVELLGIDLASVTFTISLNAPRVDIRAEVPASATRPRIPGRVTFFIAGNARPDSSLVPSVEIELFQAFELVIVDNVVEPRPFGDLDLDIDIDVDLLPQSARNALRDLFLDERQLRDDIQRARDRLLADSLETWRELFRGRSETLAGIGPLGEVLEGFRLSRLAAKYDSVQILDHGIVVHGDLDFGQLAPADAFFESRTVRSPEGEWLVEFNAHHSWIPGGTIDLHRWVLATGDVIENEVREEHRFFTRDLPGEVVTESVFRNPLDYRRWCLEIKGRQGGKEVSDWYCLGGGGIPALPEPVGRGSARLPVPVGDAGGEVVGHIDVGSGAGDRHGARVPTLVYFAGDGEIEDLRRLQELVSGVAKSARLATIAIVEPGQREKIRAALGKKFDQSVLAIGEDVEGAWKRYFDVKKGPLTFFIDTWGQVASRYPGSPSEAMVWDFVKKQASPAGPLRLHHGHLAIARGDTAPNFVFDYGGVSVTLRTFAGRPIVVCFWTGWSEPSLRELGRLEKLFRAAKDGLLVVAVNDGEDVEAAEAIFAKQKLTMPMVSDPRRRIAGRYGVGYWPTTVHLDARRKVRRIHYGVKP